MRVRKFRLQDTTQDLINADHLGITGVRSDPLNMFGPFFFKK